MPWSRRNVVKLLSGISAMPVARLLSPDWLQGLARAAAPTLAAQPMTSGFGQRLGQTYENITYKTFLIDFQFTDIDPNTMKRADAERLAEQTAETGAESLMVYAMASSGIALYNSKFAPKFKNLPDSFLGDFLEACRKRKLKMVLYHSLGCQRILDLDHPDWARLDAKGKPKIMDSSPNGFMGKTNFLCLNSPYRELALKQTKEIADRFPFDSWWIDMVGVFEAFPCYNPYCVEKWRARTGQDLPRPVPQDLYPQYIDFGIDDFRSVYRAIKDQLRASTGRDIPITHNFGLDYVDDTYVQYESNPSGRDYDETTVDTKAYRARARGRELQILPHLNNDYVDYVNAPIQQVRWQMATITSHNVSVMAGIMANVDGTVDAAALRLAKEAFTVVDRLIPKVRGTVPYAEVAVLSSERNELLTEGRGYEDFYAAGKLLIDLHWPYDVVTANPLTPDELAAFRLLIVPDVNYVSAADRQVVLNYLEKGGNVFLCGHCATVDELGRPHADANFGLVKIAQETHASRGYIKPSFPIDDERLKATDIVTVEPDASHQVMGRLIRLSATRREGFPLEDVAYPLETTDQPVIVIGRKGKGQFIYAGYRFFQEYHKQNLPVIADVFRHLVSGFYMPAVWVEAPTVVNAIYNQLGPELRIALVNGITAKPSGAINPVSGELDDFYINVVEVIPLSDLKIVLRGKKVQQATNLMGEKLNVTMERGNTVITVPRLEQYDLVTVDLG
jgi:hypothetical protein